ncbi:hypothetical protein O9992_20305 [Vibrio lentus]|nr:hypothetical protein [Vibrio lentus]
MNITLGWLTKTHLVSYTISGIPDGLNITLNGNARLKRARVRKLKSIRWKSEPMKTLRVDSSLRLLRLQRSKNTFADPNDKTADIVNTVVVEISPDADTPHVSVKATKA